MFDLKIGFDCNNNCIHCVVAEKRSAGSLSMLDIRNIVSTIPYGSSVQITGGEPSQYSYLPEILALCKDRNLTTVIQSNATGFANRSFLDKCDGLIDHVHVAIHSSNEAVHNKIVHDNKGIMWKLTLDGWKNLIDKGISTTTQTVLSTYNIETLYDTFSFIQSIKPGTQMSMTYPHLMGNALKNKDDICFRYSDYKDIIQKTLKDFSSYIFTEAIPSCITYPYLPVASAEADILAGISRDGIDFSDSATNKKNYNLLDTRSKRKGPLCKECIFNNRCLGVWKEYIDMYKNRLDLIPVKENLR